MPYCYVSGLENIQSVGSNLDIRGNTQITSMSSLRNLRGPISGLLRVEGNDALVSLDGFEGLRSFTTSIMVGLDSARDELSGD